MESEDLLLVDVSNPFGRDGGIAWEGMDHFAEEVGKHNDRVVAVRGLWELCDEINTNRLPRGVWYFKRLSGGSRMLRVLPSGAGVTSFYVFLDKGSHVWPPVVSIQSFQSAMYARVSGCGVIVALMDHLSPKLVVLEDITPDDSVLRVPCARYPIARDKTTLHLRYTYPPSASRHPPTNI